MRPGEIAYGTPDYETRDGANRWVPDAWAEGLSDAEVAEVQAAGGRVAFSIDDAGRSQVYRDRTGRFLVEPATGGGLGELLSRDLLGVPLWGWAVGVAVLVASE